VGVGGIKRGAGERRGHHSQGMKWTNVLVKNYLGQQRVTGQFRQENGVNRATRGEAKITFWKGGGKLTGEMRDSRRGFKMTDRGFKAESVKQVSGPGNSENRRVLGEEGKKVLKG